MTSIQATIWAICRMYNIPYPHHVEKLTRGVLGCNHGVPRWKYWGSFLELVIASCPQFDDADRESATIHVRNDLQTRLRDAQKSLDVSSSLDVDDDIVIDSFGNLHVYGEWDECWERI